jgi:hypothetical protein
MSANSYSAMSDESLLETFVATAKLSRAGRIYEMLRRGPNAPQEETEHTPESLKAAADVRAIGPELRGRLSIAQMRGLMDGDDPHVRMCAAGQFFSSDEEWASSTWVALAEELPTRDIVGFRAAARRPPPQTPSLQNMSDDELLTRFKDSATRLDWARFLDYVEDPSDLEARNRVIGEGVPILREIKARGLLEQLIPLMGGSNDCIRFRAALGCMRIAEPQAIAALEAIAARNNFDASIFAKSALAHWRNGDALVDAL